MDQNRVVAFSEKPTLSDCWINGGIFAADAALLDAIEGPDDRLEDQVMQRLIARNGVVAMRHARWWRSIDTPKDVKAAMKEDLTHFAFAPDHQPRLAPVSEHGAKAKI
jgi:NDP-sugar pyrophosphorylase family protein